MFRIRKLGCLLLGHHPDTWRRSDPHDLDCMQLCLDCSRCGTELWTLRYAHSILRRVTVRSLWQVIWDDMREAEEQISAGRKQVVW